MLSRVRYGAFLAYSPRGQGATSAASRRILHAIKNDQEGPPGAAESSMIGYAARRLQEVGGPALEAFFGEGTVLVPIPRSAPFPPHQKGGLWVPRRICEELCLRGLGTAVEPCLQRVVRVRKAAFSTAESRPLPSDHWDSIRIVNPPLPPARITLVDDVITQGATALAATSRIAEAFPSTLVQIFALVRARGLVEEVSRIVDPVAGWIEYRDRRAWRDHP